MPSKKHLLSSSQIVDIFSTSKNATAIFTGEDIIIEFANNAILAFWGKDKRIIGLPLEEGVPELRGQPFKRMLQQVLKTGITDAGVISAETMIGGILQTRYYDYEYKALNNSLGQTYGILCTASDVTEGVLGKQAAKLASERETALIREQALNEQLAVSNEELIATNDELKAMHTNLQRLNNELDERVKSRTRSLEESEARFRSMAESSGILIALADETRNFVYLTRAWIQLTGHTTEKLLGFGWIDMLHPDDQQHALSSYMSAFKRHEPFTAEFRILNHKNDYCWLLAKGFPRVIQDDTIVGYIISCMDITELKEAEQRKDDFISIASHELKTPLTSLKASLQILDKMKDGFDSKQLVHLIGQANKSMDKITGLVNDLLNTSRTREGFLPLNKTTFIVADMLNTCCNHVRAEGKYNLVFEGDTTLQVYADEARIEQVVVNFVNNAIKYAPDSKDIFLKVEKLENVAKISVKDTGPGIAEDKIPRLFERYYRADYSGMRYSGLGLGLYISSEIIKRHGGEIGVDTEIGKGSMFWFTLPLE